MPPKKLEQELKDPRLTLFAFHLQHDITQDSQEGAKNADQLWLRCADLGEKLGIDQLRSLPKLLKDSQPNLASQQPHLELLQPQRVLTFQANPQSDNAYLAGEAYPVQLHDTYALDLTLHYVETTVPVEVDDLNQLNPKGGLLPCQIQASLGQTLLLFAQPTQILCDYRTLADSCVKALLKDVDHLCSYSIDKGQLPCISRVAEGQLFSSPIFEYDVISGGLQNPIDQCHILVWLNRYPEKTLNLAKKAYSSLLHLLCYRSKILYAYQESQWCNDKARQLYSELEKTAQTFNQLSTKTENRLQQLKQLITDIPPVAFKFSHYLRDIEDHRTTIATNAHNYAANLEAIRALSLPDDDLGFWQNFCDRTSKQFQDQIQVDLKYLAPGRDLFEQMIATIRGMVEIEQAESERQLQEQLQSNERAERKREQESEEAEKQRDRDLQILLAAVGSGFVVGEVSSSVKPNIFSHNSSSDDAKLTPSNIVLSLLDVLIHVMTAFLFTVLVGFIVSYGLNPQGTKQSALLLWKRVLKRVMISRHQQYETDSSHKTGKQEGSEGSDRTSSK